MKYRKKPVVIEAIEFIDFQSIMDMLRTWEDDFNDVMSYDEASNALQIFTLEGMHKATVGDFIIRGVKGEFYPCKPDIFNMTYDKVEEA